MLVRVLLLSRFVMRCQKCKSSLSLLKKWCKEYLMFPSHFVIFVLTNKKHHATLVECINPVL